MTHALLLPDGLGPGDTPRMSDDDTQVRWDSDHLLAEVRRLRELEERKRREPISSPEFHRLAEQVEERARAVWKTADHERAAGDSAEQQSRTHAEVDPLEGDPSTSE